MARLGVRMGLYTEAELRKSIFKKGLLEPPMDVAADLWNEIGIGRYRPTVTKATKLRDPLHRYLHRVTASTISARGSSTGVATTKDMFFLHCLIHHERCNLAYALALFFDGCCGPTPASATCGGSFITELAFSYGFMAPEIIAGLHASNTTKLVDPPMLTNMKLAEIDREEGWHRFRCNGPWATTGVYVLPPPPFHVQPLQPEQAEEQNEPVDDAVDMED